MKRACLSFFLVAALAFVAAAADISGKWAGDFTPENGGSSPVVLNLKQSGTTVTGTGGPEDQQWPIQSGKIEGNKLTMEVKSPEDGTLYKCQLVLDGDHLKLVTIWPHELANGKPIYPRP